MVTAAVAAWGDHGWAQRTRKGEMSARHQGVLIRSPLPAFTLPPNADVPARSGTGNTNAPTAGFPAGNSNWFSTSASNAEVPEERQVGWWELKAMLSLDCCCDPRHSPQCSYLAFAPSDLRWDS